jgi:hypothetical protein
LKNHDHFVSKELLQMRIESSMGSSRNHQQSQLCSNLDYNMLVMDFHSIEVSSNAHFMVQPAITAFNSISMASFPSHRSQVTYPQGSPSSYLATLYP